jgi:DNA repair protein RadC
VPVYQREILKRVLQLNASALILLHNHPSENPQPSPQDRTLTTQIVAAADTVGVCILEHLIISSDDSFSFRSEGLF